MGESVDQRFNENLNGDWKMETTKERHKNKTVRDGLQG